MFGRAVAERGVVLTGDYLADPAFTHAEDPDRVVRDIGIRSMVGGAARRAGRRSSGRSGTFRARRGAFRPSADRPRPRAGRPRRGGDGQRAPHRGPRHVPASSWPSARRSSARSARSRPGSAPRPTSRPCSSAASTRPPASSAPTGRGSTSSIPSSGLLRWAYASGAVRPDDRRLAGRSGRDPRPGGLRPGRRQRPGVLDRRLPPRRPRSRTVSAPTPTSRAPGRPLGHGRAADRGERSVRAPDHLQQPARPVGRGRRRRSWSAIADQAAITIRTTRLIDELDRSRDALARRAEAEQALREIAARITVLREPAEILQDVVAQAGRLVGADGVILDLLDPTTGNLHWAYRRRPGRAVHAEERAKLWISVGVGATGMAVAEDRVIVADDDLAAQFPPSPESTEFYERTGFRSMIAAPITGENGPLGVIEVYSKERRAFTETDAGAGRGARQPGRDRDHQRPADRASWRGRAGSSARTADAERTLREIAGRVSAMHDKDEILQAVIDAAVRLLGATGAMIDMLGDDGHGRGVDEPGGRRRAVVEPRPARRGRASSPTPACPVGAVRTRQVEWTGDYLEDDAVRRTPAPATPSFAKPASSSVIAAPLVHRDVVVGAITVYGDRGDAFDEADAGAAGRPGRPGCRRHRQREPHRRARAVARGDRPPRRLGADIARDRRARVGHPRPGRGPPADHRRGDPAARSDGARIDLYDPTIDALRWSYAAATRCPSCPTGRRPAASSRARRWPAPPSPSSARSGPTDYLDDERFDHRRRHRRVRRRRSGIRAVIVDAAVRRCQAARDALGRLAPAGRLRRGGPRGPDRPRHAGIDRDPQRAPDGGAGPIARPSSSAAPRRSRRCARSPPGSPRSASRATCSSGSSTRRAACSAPTAR